jgi:putative ABC transport system permease protein
MDLDTWAEIGAVLRRNKLRTAMTAMGVFWGLLMLILMLGFGQGLEQTATKNFSRSSTNSVFMWGGRTSLPYKGERPGKWIGFRNGDIQPLSELEGLAFIAPRTQLGGWRNGNLVVRGAKTGSYNVMGDVPDMFKVASVELVQGRLLNPLDLEEQRKVAVIGSQVLREIFEGDPPIGELIRVQGVYFQVVGVVRSIRADERGDRDNNAVHVPFTTFQKAFNVGDSVGWFALMAEEDVSAADLEARAKAVLFERHGVHPNDDNAVGSYNAQEEVQRIQNLFTGIRLFVWFVGAATLLSGVVGVSNIMLVVVRERTKELGLRRALGATAWNIVGLIVTEAVVLTSIAGWLGLAAGLAIVEISAWMIGNESEAIGPPSVEIPATLTALAVLVLAGILAGLLPAQRAAQVHPVEALRTE